MKGKNFLKVTGILMIIGSIIGIFAAVIGILGLSTLVALAGSAEGAGMLLRPASSASSAACFS